MDDQLLGRTLRALRLRSHLSQRGAATRAGISQSTWSRIERGHLAHVSTAVLRTAFGVVDARVELNAQWRGGDIDRLRDGGHAAVVHAIVEMLEGLGWQTAVEVTYSQYGERGSVDVIAVRRDLGIALIIEVKTSITSEEQMLRRLDEKARLGKKIVFDRFGWRPSSVGRLLVLESTTTNRRRVAALETVLLRAFPLRSDAARAWLRKPSGAVSGLIFLSPARRPGR